MAITRLNNNSLTSITALPSAVAVENTPFLQVGRSTPQNISDNTWTTIVFDTEIYDANNIYNTSTGVCTPTAGTYLMNFIATVGNSSASSDSIHNCGVKFNIGGTETCEVVTNPLNKGRYWVMTISYIHTFNGSTYVIPQAYADVSSGQAAINGNTSPKFGASFTMNKLIT